MQPAALIIIDVQEALAQGAFKIDQVLGNVQQLITAARNANAPVVYVQHNHATFDAMRKGTPGWQIHAAIAPVAGDLIIEKEACDAFYATPLATQLRQQNINRLVITGMQTEYCVDATVRSAVAHEFDVTLVADAHTTGDATLPAAQIIAHHNELLPNLVHPICKVTLTASADVKF